MSKYLIDTNCLLILLIGLLSQNYLYQFGKTKQYTHIYPDLEIYYSDPHTIFVSNALVLAEISHLTLEHKDFSENYKTDLVKIIQDLLKTKKLRLVESEIDSLLQDKRIFYLGLVDISLLGIAQLSNFSGFISTDGELNNFMYSYNLLPIFP